MRFRRDRRCMMATNRGLFRVNSATGPQSPHFAHIDAARVVYAVRVGVGQKIRPCEMAAASRKLEWA